MSVTSSEALERSVLEAKDREQLLTIAGALGVKAMSRAKKADIIDKILDQVGASSPDGGPSGTVARPPRSTGDGRTPNPAPQTQVTVGDGADADADDHVSAAAASDSANAGNGDRDRDSNAPNGSGAVATVRPASSSPAPSKDAVVLGADGEPLAEWELELAGAQKA